MSTPPASPCGSSLKRWEQARTALGHTQVRTCTAQCTPVLCRAVLCRSVLCFCCAVPRYARMQCTQLALDCASACVAHAGCHMPAVPHTHPPTLLPARLAACLPAWLDAVGAKLLNIRGGQSFATGTGQAKNLKLARHVRALSWHGPAWQAGVALHFTSPCRLGCCMACSGQSPNLCAAASVLTQRVPRCLCPAACAPRLLQVASAALLRTMLETVPAEDLLTPNRLKQGGGKQQWQPPQRPGLGPEGPAGGRGRGGRYGGGGCRFGLEGRGFGGPEAGGRRAAWGRGGGGRFGPSSRPSGYAEEAQGRAYGSAGSSEGAAGGGRYLGSGGGGGGGGMPMQQQQVRCLPYHLF